MLYFHMDENVEMALAWAMRNRGLNVTTTPPDLPKKTADLRQIEFALSQSRVIITHDTDMLALHSQGTVHGGIAFSYVRTRSLGQLIEMLAGLARRYDHGELNGRVEYL